MKRLIAPLLVALSFVGVGHAAYFQAQTYLPSGFNPTTVASEAHVFGMDDPSDPTQYLVPGNGAPAISTSQFYNSAGLYNFRPYDLDTMGAPGAAVKAANGGRRYVWFASADHPVFGYAWTGGTAFIAGYSFQPWDFPRQMSEVIIANNSFSTPSHSVSGGFVTYQAPTLSYNPDDPDGLPFYIMAETGPTHWTGLWRSADLVTFTVKEISHWHTTDQGAIGAQVAAGGSGYSAGTQLLTLVGGTCSIQPQFNVTVVAGAITAPTVVTAGQCSANPSNPVSTTGGGGTGGTLNVFFNTWWSSFVRYVQRTGTNAFTTIALSGLAPTVSIWTTINGIDYTTASVPISGFEGSPDSFGSVFSLGGTFSFGSQLYGVGREDATGGGNNQYCTIFPMNSTTFDKLNSPAKFRVASGWANLNFPGPGFLQECVGYPEDGILYALPTYGFPNDVGTTAQGNGRGGTYYADGAGLDQQFIDKLVIRFDDVAARQAAPVGMGVSAVSGTATITWKNALPQNTYRLYRGTNATTQATLIGDYTSVTSATDSPSTGRYWYKLVTLDSGVERKSRVLSVYVSSSSAFINEHINRVLDDGGDISTVNQAFLDRTDTMLTSVGIRNVLELFTHPAVGVKTSTSPIKIYDLGTTRLPRSEDFKPTTAATTYSATAVNGGPAWTNANNNSYGYWGNPKRGNTIQKKRKLSIVVAYERTQTTEDFTFVGTGPIFGTSFTGNAIITLKHTAGTPGNIEFSLSDETSTKTASVAASGSGMQIAIGTYDGTSMLAYTGSTAGTAVTTLDPNPNFGKNTAPGVEGWVNSSLAGARNLINNGGSPYVLGSPFPAIYPLLGSGSVQNYVLRRYGVADVMTFTETNAKGKIQCVMVLEDALTPTQIGNIITFLQSTTNW